MNTYGSIGNETAGYYVRVLLAHAMPVLVLERFSVGKTLPRNETKTLLFRRSKAFSPATMPLTEGVTPNGSDFGYDKVQVTIQQYGDWAGITDHVQDTSKDMVLRDMGERQGEQIAETREMLTWDIVRAGTNVAYGGAITSRTGINNTALLTSAKQRSQITMLKRLKAKKFTQVLSSSAMYETYAIEASYVGVAHTDLDPTIRDLAGTIDTDHFTPTSRYGSSMKLLSPHELGAYEDVRYVTSPDLLPFAGVGASWAATSGFRGSNSKYDVYPVLFLGRDSYGCVVLRGVADKAGKRVMGVPVRPTVVNTETPSASDPLGQRGSIGWKMWFACVVLNDTWLRRLEVACPA